MAGVQVIRKNKTNPWDNALGIIGQGIAGYANGSMAKQRMDMMNSNNTNMQKLLERMWGANGAGIQAPTSNPIGEAPFGAAVGAINAGAGIPAQNAPAMPGAQNTPNLSSLMPTLDLSFWR